MPSLWEVHPGKSHWWICHKLIEVKPPSRTNKHRVTVKQIVNLMEMVWDTLLSHKKTRPSQPWAAANQKPKAPPSTKSPPTACNLPNKNTLTPSPKTPHRPSSNGPPNTRIGRSSLSRRSPTDSNQWETFRNRVYSPKRPLPPLAITLPKTCIQNNLAHPSQRKSRPASTSKKNYTTITAQVPNNSKK